MKKTTLVLASTLAASIALPTSAAVKLGTVGDALEKTEMSFGGYIKIDGFWSDYSSASDVNQLNRQFFVASTVPVGNEGSRDPEFDFHARESRFNFNTVTNIGGHKIRTFMEFDFMATAGGNERISNSYTPRMRHAFISYDNLLVGQTWSTFQNVGALAENLDFVGPAESTIFERQVQVRYTMGNWQFAVENPETTVTPFGGGARITTDKNTMPDLVARYNHKADWGSVSIAGIYRQLKIDNNGIDDTTNAYGVSVAGKLKVGDLDDFRFMLNSGSGLGRYLGLNIANGAVLDQNNQLEAIDSVAGFVSYRHFWNEQWRSNATYSFFQADNDIKLTGTAVTKSSHSVHFNLIYSPVKKLDFGTEIMFAERENEAGVDGDMTRLQFSAKYAL